jgi:hypothetical protein
MCLFNSAAASSPAPPPKIVDTTNTNSATFTQNAADAKSKAALAFGQGATDLSGPLGTAAQPTTAQKTLLGS